MSSCRQSDSPSVQVASQGANIVCNQHVTYLAKIEREAQGSRTGAVRFSAAFQSRIFAVEVGRGE